MRLGDDPEELARRGWDVTAFDISATAVRWARAARGIAGLVAEEGIAVVIARGAGRRITDGPPWPLIEEDLRPLEDAGLERLSRTVDRESGVGPVRRWTLTYRRSG